MQQLLLLTGAVNAELISISKSDNSVQVIYSFKIFFLFQSNFMSTLTYICINILCSYFNMFFS